MKGLILGVKAGTAVKVGEGGGKFCLAAGEGADGCATGGAAAGAGHARGAHGHSSPPDAAAAVEVDVPAAGASVVNHGGAAHAPGEAGAAAAARVTFAGEAQGAMDALERRAGAFSGMCLGQTGSCVRPPPSVLPLFGSQRLHTPVHVHWLSL